LESLKNAGTDGTRENLARAVAQLAESNKGCVAIVEAGGCGVIMQALKVAQTDDTRGNIALVIGRLVENHDCSIPSFRQFLELSVCSFLADALAAVSNDTARLAISNCVSLLFDTAAQSVENFSELQITELRTLCASKGILTSGNRNDRKELAALLTEIGTTEQKGKLLCDTDICSALFVALKHSSNEETQSSILEGMFAIISDSNSDGVAKMFNVDGISLAFTVALKSALHSDDVLRSIGRVLDELIVQVGSASTANCAKFFAESSHLGEALVSAWAHSNHQDTKHQISVAICNLSAAAQRFQGCQEVIEINICATSSRPELDAAFKLALVAPRIDDVGVKKVIRSVIAKFVKGWTGLDPDQSLRRWRQWARFHHQRKSYFEDNGDEKDEEIPVVSDQQVLTLVTALHRSKKNVEKYSNISLAIAIISNVLQCMDMFIKCASALDSKSQKIGSIESADIFGAIWIGIISASDRKEAKVCSGLCSRIGSSLHHIRHNGKCLRQGDTEQSFICHSFLDSFTTLCSSRGSGVCGSWIYALISSCSERRPEIHDDDDDDDAITNIVQGMLFCIKNSEPSLKLFDRDNQCRDVLLTAVKSTDNDEAHRNVAVMIGLLNSQEHIVSSLQAATSAEEKSRLASCLARCDLKKIKLNKSSPACKEVIDALVGVLKHANDRRANVIVDAIQSLDGSDELIEHLVASVQAAPSAAEISKLARCMAHCDMKQFDWEHDFKSFRKRGIEALTAAWKSSSIKLPMSNSAIIECDLAIQCMSDALLKFIGKGGCGAHYDIFEPLSALAISLVSVSDQNVKRHVAASISQISCNMSAEQKSSPACKEVIDALVGVLKHANDRCANVIVDAIQSLDGSDELIEHLVASVQAAPSAAEISSIARCMAHCDMKQFDFESDFRSLRKRGIEALTAALKTNSIQVPMPNPAIVECDRAIQCVSDALLNFIGKAGCGAHYDMLEPLSALAISLVSVSDQNVKRHVAASISQIGCNMSAEQKSSPACKEVIDALVGVLKHAGDLCANVIVDAIQSLDGCKGLIIALSSAECDNEIARIASAIHTITQRRLNDSANSESSSSVNKKQKIGGAFSP